MVHRYWEAETSPEEEQDLARYVAGVDDPDFDEIRGVLGYLSFGRRKRGLKPYSIEDFCVSYVYGTQTFDNEVIMASVESSLADFFAGDTPAETQLIEMFQR